MTGDFVRSADWGADIPAPTAAPLWDLVPQARYTVTVQRVVNKDWTFTFTGRLVKGGAGAAKLVFTADHGVKVEVRRNQILDVVDPVEEAA